MPAAPLPAFFARGARLPFPRKGRPRVSRSTSAGDHPLSASSARCSGVVCGCSCASSSAARASARQLSHMTFTSFVCCVLPVFLDLFSPSPTVPTSPTSLTRFASFASSASPDSPISPGQQETCNLHRVCEGTISGCIANNCSRVSIGILGGFFACTGWADKNTEPGSTESRVPLGPAILSGWEAMPVFGSAAGSAERIAAARCFRGFLVAAVSASSERGLSVTGRKVSRWGVECHGGLEGACGLSSSAVSLSSGDALERLTSDPAKDDFVADHI